MRHCCRLCSDNSATYLVSSPTLNGILQPERIRVIPSGEQYNRKEYVLYPLVNRNQSGIRAQDGNFLDSDGHRQMRYH
ncbi:hypothetical protein ACOMHN_057386 [Nucella lapillus]